MLSSLQLISTFLSITNSHQHMNIFGSTDNRGIQHETEEQEDSRPRKFLWVVPLAPHTRPIQFFTFLFAVFTAMSIIVYLSASQAFILTTVLVQKDSTGDITGSLALYGEIIALVMVFIWGAVSDRIQKRSIYCVSILLMGLAVILYPHVKNVYPGLLLLKLIFSAGSAGCTTMMTAMMTDVVHGKGGMVSGIIGACSGLGAIFASFALFSVPAKLGISTGSQVQGIVLSFGIIGGCTMFIGIIIWFLLPKAKQARVEPLYTRIKNGVFAGKDPRIALAFSTSFFARADEIILTSFISLWINQYYIDAGQCQVGVPCYLAYGATGTITGIGQSVSLASAPFFGLASEFLPKPYPIIAAGLIGAAGCFPFAFSFDPTTKASLVFVILIAVGELGKTNSFSTHCRVFFFGLVTDSKIIRDDYFGNGYAQWPICSQRASRQYIRNLLVHRSVWNYNYIQSWWCSFRQMDERSSISSSRYRPLPCITLRNGCPVPQ